MHKARIGVIGPPYVHPIPDQTVVVGQPLTITCSYSGYPIEEVFFVKDKRRLPFDERHLIGQQLGQLHISQVEKSDEGVYHCVVVAGNNGGNGNGNDAANDNDIGQSTQRAQQAFRIITVQPPVLSPFIFSDDLEEGTRATAVCSVISGDPPITLQWLKDGQPINGGSTNSRLFDSQIQVHKFKLIIILRCNI